LRVRIRDFRSDSVVRAALGGLEPGCTAFKGAPPAPEPHIAMSFKTSREFNSNHARMGYVAGRAVTNPIDALDEWLRRDFVRINTELEEAYFAERVEVLSGRPDLETLKRALLRQGGELMERLAGMRALPDDSRARYRLLGMIGHYLAACERHEAPLSDAKGGRQAAWSLSVSIGNSLGVVPRYVFAHQALFHDAIAGRYRTFTSLPDEEVFIRFNALAVLAYRRAANALRDIPDMGVSSPMAAYLYGEAEAALGDVLGFNQALSQQLAVDRFYFNVRPYFKTHRVGQADYRGVNAGDFAAINEIDVTLGLCRIDDEFYRSVVRDKAGYVPPDDQHTLGSLDRRPSLLERFCRELDSHGVTAGWRVNATLFLRVCKAHGAAAAYHHYRLVKPYLERPSRALAAAAATTQKTDVTTSGLPLDRVMAMLQRLVDLRTARDRPDIGSAAAALRKLRDALPVDA
jgi:hypothetical protein